MRILYDSKSSSHKKPFGCIKINELCEISLHIPQSCKTMSASLCLSSEDGFSMTIPLKKAEEKDGYEFYNGSFSLFKEGLYFYYFKITTEGSSFSLYKQGFSDTNIEAGDLWQLTCISPDYKTPDFFKGAVYYQIFPDRFYKDNVLPATQKNTPYILHENEWETPVYMPDENGIIQNNDFYGGNIPGIMKKLPYLKSLGVSVIYLNPIFSAYSNHRYDTSDYMKTDDLLGTEKDFANLCKSAHEMGIKIILDGVFSHTGADSIYFDKYNRYGGGAFQNPDSSYRPWFQFSEYPHKYTSWWGIDTLPCVNELEESYLDYIIKNDDSVIAHWLNLGADGFRLDVADELPDEFISLLRKRVKEINPDAIVLGEVWEDASNKISYGVRRKYFADSELDSVMNYPFRDNIIAFVKGEISAWDLSNVIMTICENYPEEVVHCLLNSLSTHDTPRILTLMSPCEIPSSKESRANFTLSGDALSEALEKEMFAAFLQFMLPGAPCIYYGDEAGLEGCEDPFNRRFFPWGRENLELADFYKELSGLKNSIPSLKLGDTLISRLDDGVIEIARSLGDDTVYACLSRDKDFTIDAKEIIFSKNADGNYLRRHGFVLYRK